MTDVDAVLQHLRSLLGQTAIPEWPVRDFGSPVPGVPDWTGDTSSQAHDASRKLDAIRAELSEIYASAGPLVQQAGEVAGFAQRSMDAIIAQWQADKAALAPYMTTGRGRVAYIQLGQVRIADATQVLSNAEQGFAALATRIQGVTGRLPAPRGGGTGPAGSSSDIPRWGSPTDEVKRWWESRTKAEQDALLGEQPELIGQLDGLPAAVRDQANRAVLAADLSRVDDAAAAHHVSSGEVTAHPHDFGLTPIDVLRYNNAGQTRSGLDEQRKTTGAPTMLLIYQPEAFDGQGRAAIALNNPDTADNVSVLVPGTSHSVAEGWLHAADAANLYQQMRAAGGGRNAVIAWMGYDAPDSLGDGRVATTGLAHEGAGLLVSDVNGFRDAALGDPHYTVIGHSYGSTTVADAAWIGMKTNDVVLIGSPGTDMAHSAADFNLPADGHLYVGSASTDPITQLGKLPAIPLLGNSETIGLGPDPAAADFGSIRFRAEVPGITFNDHSHYYQPGTESLRSIGLITTGHGAALHSQNLLAPSRSDLLDQVVKTGIFGPLGAISDMELPRLPWRTDK